MNVGFLVMVRPNRCRSEICSLKPLKLSTSIVPPIGFEKLSLIWVSRTVAVRGLQEKILVTPASKYVISTIIIRQVSCVTPTYRQPSVELGHPGAAWFLDRSKRSDQYQVFGPIKMRRLKTSWCAILGLESHAGRQTPKHYQTSLQGSIKREWSYHEILQLTTQNVKIYIIVSTPFAWL